MPWKVLFHWTMQLLLLSFLTTRAIGSEINYFDSGINYWEKKADEKSNEDKPKPKKRLKGFNWDKYLDPENDEFFKEGNYIPPAPFMEVYRRPTKENVLMWDKYIKKRNLVHKRALRNMKKYLAPTPKKIREVEQSKPLELANVFSGKWVLFYFDKRCSYCQAMYTTINKLARSGVAVQAIRLDGNSGPVEGLSIPWVPIKKGEKERLKITVTPTILVVSGDKKKVQKLTGRVSLKDIIKHAKEI